MIGRGAVGLLALVLAACGPRPVAPRPGDAAGVALVVYAARVGGAVGRAYVDDRRWIAVPADGELELPGVAAGLTLDSVVLESVSDPGGLAARRCQVVASADGLRDGAWLIGRAVTLVTAAGARVAGTVLEVADPRAVLEAGDGGRVPVAPSTLRRARGDTDRDADLATPRAGELAVGTSRDGEELGGRLVATEPDRLVVRGEDGRRHEVRVDAIVHLGVSGAPAATALRCAVHAARPGRHLVRLSYATTDVSWRASYRIVLPGAGAEAGVDAVAVVPQLEIHAPGFPARRTARVRLIAGLPDDDEPSVEAWAGEVTVGGGVVAVRGPSSRRRARVDRVYRGAIADDDESPRSLEWRTASAGTVWRELAFERLPTDVPGILRVGVADDDGVAGWIDGTVPAANDGDPPVVRLPLWIEPDLVGFRRKSGRDLDGTGVIDEVVFSVANRGDRPVTVRVEEKLRGLVRPRVVFERPAGVGTLRRDRWATTLELAPGAVGQGVVVFEYRLPRY